MPAVRSPALVAFAFLLAACGPHLTPPEDAAADVNNDVQLAPPVLQVLPPLAPYWVATIRGSSGADRVSISIMGTGATSNPSFATPGLDGNFCQGITLPGPGTYTFVAHALLGGLTSAASNIVTTTFSPSAPAVTGASTCMDIDPADCTSTGVCCAPNCGARTCGDNGCGGMCGAVCPAGQSCSTATGHCCSPSCTGHTCGDDGCGGSCGAPCSSGQVCTAGHCGTAPCTAHTTCGPCVLAPAPFCGWCAAAAQCLPGGSSGPTNGACSGSDWHYTTDSCP